jgi:hypothetical protein
MLRLLCVPLILGWLLGASAAPAQEPPASASPSPTEFAAPPLYVIVPFGEPGDTDPVLLHSTDQFSQDLSDRRVRSTIGVPADAVEAVANVRGICAQYGAQGVLISELRFSQTKNFSVSEFAVSFVPWVGGAIAGAGVLDRTPIFARYKLFLVDCRGKVTWRTITTANKIHHGNNLAAGLTEISYKAIAQAADEFASRRAQAH